MCSTQFTENELKFIKKISRLMIDNAFKEKLERQEVANFVNQIILPVEIKASWMLRKGHFNKEQYNGRQRSNDRKT